MRQVEKVTSNSSLYSDTKKVKIFLNERNVKTAKQEHAFIGYVRTHNVAISSYFNPELQLKDTESVIESKVIELLTQLKGFKFVTTLVLVFNNSESKKQFRNKVWQFFSTSIFFESRNNYERK